MTTERVDGWRGIEGRALAGRRVEGLRRYSQGGSFRGLAIWNFRIPGAIPPLPCISARHGLYSNFPEISYFYPPTPSIFRTISISNDRLSISIEVTMTVLVILSHDLPKERPYTTKNIRLRQSAFRLTEVSATSTESRSAH